MKEELHKDMGSLKKKMNETEILEIKSSSSQKKKNKNKRKIQLKATPVYWNK
jgi:hypothetical protein